MKTWFFIAVICCRAYSSSLGDDKAKITIVAVDEDSRPLSDVSVDAKFLYGTERKGQTGTNGVFILEGEAGGWDTWYGLQKNGYYRSEGKFMLSRPVSGIWQPWNPVVTAVVRRIVNPIPMYAKKVETKIPKIDTPYGFDLQVGDWVSPVGRGVTSDLVFSIKGFWNTYRDNDSTLSLAFSEPRDGLITVSHEVFDGRPVGSMFILPRYAPDGGFTNLYKWRLARKPVSGSTHDNRTDEVNVAGQDYLFRVRSQTNEAGVVTNAFYGKLHGNFEFVGAAGNGQGSWLKFTYYLNPTPNDRNLEFDPKRNLFQNLKSTERVNLP